MDTTTSLNMDVSGMNDGITYFYLCSNSFGCPVEIQYDELRLGTSWNDAKLHPVGIQQNTDIQLSLNASPNPFSSTTTISYNLASGQDVSVKIYDMMGKEVTVLANGHQDAGKQQLTLSSEKLATGMYICKLQAGETVTTKSLIVQK